MGQPIPENLSGRDITPVLEGGDSLENEDVFIEWNRSDGHPIPGEAEVNPQMGSPWRTIVTAERWKLNMSPDDQCELFDLNSDPSEMVNLYDDPTQASRANDLARRLKRWQQENDDEVLLPDVANTARS
jgi:arylsulfatase A-like enzyme